MSPVKIALAAALFVAFASGATAVVQEDIDALVPELAEQPSDDEMAQQRSDDEMAQDSDDEMDQLPEGIDEEQLAQATDKQRSSWGGKGITTGGVPDTRRRQSTNYRRRAPLPDRRRRITTGGKGTWG